jgi:hypothetical protein
MREEVDLKRMWVGILRLRRVDVAAGVHVLPDFGKRT